MLPARVLLPAVAIVLVGSSAACRRFAEPTLNETTARGQEIFRHDTFGDEAYWTDTVRLADLVEKNVGPINALRMGLKVDMTKINVLTLLQHNPFGTGATRSLLRMNAVVGVRAQLDDKNHITRIGITCALCHSTVDNALLPGIGYRVDGQPNRDLNVGAILAMSPAFTAAQKSALNSWGRGRYDPRINFDGKSTPLVLPPAYGLAAVKNETYTAEGPISYWNAYVAVTQMHGKGSFSDPRLGVYVVNTPDMVTPKLAALREYQHSLPTPAGPIPFFRKGSVADGRKVFDAACASCHVNGNLTDNNSGVLHPPSETGMNAAYASRTTTKQYRTTPLRGLWQHPPYFHDGSAPTLEAVVTHYNNFRRLGLTTTQQQDLVQYLKSL